MAEIDELKEFEWDRPIFKNGTVSVPKPILKALGYPAEIRFSLKSKNVIIKAIKKVEPNGEPGKPE